MLLQSTNFYATTKHKLEVYYYKAQTGSLTTKHKLEVYATTKHKLEVYATTKRKFMHFQLEMV